MRRLAGIAACAFGVVAGGFGSVHDARACTPRPGTIEVLYPPPGAEDVPTNAGVLVRYINLAGAPVTTLASTGAHTPARLRAGPGDDDWLRAVGHVLLLPEAPLAAQTPFDLRFAFEPKFGVTRTATTASTFRTGGGPRSESLAAPTVEIFVRELAIDPNMCRPCDPGEPDLDVHTLVRVGIPEGGPRPLLAQVELLSGDGARFKAQTRLVTGEERVISFEHFSREAEAACAVAWLTDVTGAESTATRACEPVACEPMTATPGDDCETLRAGCAAEGCACQAARSPRGTPLALLGFGWFAFAALLRVRRRRRGDQCSRPSDSASTR